MRPCGALRRQACRSLSSSTNSEGRAAPELAPMRRRRRPCARASIIARAICASSKSASIAPASASIAATVSTAVVGAEAADLVDGDRCRPSRHCPRAIVPAEQEDAMSPARPRRAAGRCGGIGDDGQPLDRRPVPRRRRAWSMPVSMNSVSPGSTAAASVRAIAALASAGLGHALLETALGDEPRAPRAAMHLVKRARAGKVRQVAPDRLGRDVEVRGQRLDRDRAIAADDLEDPGLALLRLHLHPLEPDKSVTELTVSTAIASGTARTGSVRARRIDGYGHIGCE